MELSIEEETRLLMVCERTLGPAWMHGVGGAWSARSLDDWEAGKGGYVRARVTLCVCVCVCVCVGGGAT
jgi:hypothetical protein